MGCCIRYFSSSSVDEIAKRGVVIRNPLHRFWCQFALRCLFEKFKVVGEVK